LADTTRRRIIVKTLPEETDVAIVGAGPVGLAMGVALGCYGSTPWW
jgi:cation diffusion facilitator CzcD-associated flavoprotein CzcO